MLTTEWQIGRREIVADHGIVAAKHPDAAAAGLRVLRGGGNAVDAAVTTAFAVGVAEPWMSGLGGGGFMTIHLATGENVVVDYFARAPRAAAPAMYELEPGFRPDALGFSGVKDNANAVGHRAVAVPGTVAGLALALERYGTIGLKDALEPAIALAEEGFELAWHHTLVLALSREHLARYPATAAVFLTPAGEVHQPGAEAPAYLRQPDLARTLRRIADEGPAGFYRGETARAIAAELAQGGGLIAEEDLAAYEAQVVPPLAAPYRDHTVLHIPRAAGGITLLESLNVLERFDLPTLGHNGVAALHATIEASRRAWADRMAHVGDPEFVDAPLAGLASKDYAADRRAEIDPDRASAHVRPGHPWAYEGTRPLDLSRLALSLPADEGCTTHLSVIDRDRNAVALTQTLTSLFGSFVTAPGTGVLLNNSMNLFDPRPGQMNSIAPWKRPASSMAHVVALRDGRAVLAAGAPGGRRIIDTCLQVLLDVLDFGLSMQEACAAPPIDCSGPETLIDRRIPAETRDRLAAMGHTLTAREATFWPRSFASPTGVQVDADRRLRGGADPYAYGVAVGY